MRLRTALFAVFAILPAFAQTPPEWELIDHLAGSWKITGDVNGKPAHHDVQADWVFKHQFLRITEKTSAGAPASENPYDAIWYLGYDAISERYVMHLIDTFGGRFSETLGYGVRDGNQIKFVFEYPDGPFHNTYVWDPKEGSWQWLMEQKGSDGKWKSFAHLKLTRAR